MKETAPEKIYVEVTPDGTRYYCDVIKEQRTENSDIEYIRADVFIEKACDYLMEYEFNDSPTIAGRRKRVEEFRKYMKGD